MRIYDHESPIQWAYTGVKTAEEMAEDPVLRQVIERETVLYDNGDGVVYGYRFLDDLKSAFDVAAADPEAALLAVIDAMNAPKPDNDQIIADQQAQLEEQAEAIEELISMMMEGAE